MANLNKFVLLLCVLIVFASLVQLQPPKSYPSSSSSSGPYYLMALQWPKAYCNTPERVNDPCTLNPIPQDFKIHGLWPQNAPKQTLMSSTSTTCPGLLSTDVKDIQSQLEKYWPNLKGRHFDFWDYEWGKHGPWSGETPKDYFIKAVNVMQNIDQLSPKGRLIEILKEGGLIPGGRTQYTTTSIPLEILSKTGLATEIKCNLDARGREQLHEIHFCVTAFGDLFNCSNLQPPTLKLKSCKSPFIFFP
ncbi:hypothetical protein LguiA_018478 [Lonicera macranthoides]